MIEPRICKIGSEMSTRVQGASILVGLTTLGVVLASALEAQGSSIKITGQQMPGTGDPPYFYIFDVFLETNSFIQSGDSFTINNLIGVTPAGFPMAGDPGSSSGTPNASWATAAITVTSTTYPYTSSVTWTYAGTTPISAPSNPVDLGQFFVETTVSFQSPPYLVGTLIGYSYNIGAQTVSGSGTFAMSVPEPSSLIMLVAGAGMVLVPICRHRSRKRQSRLPAA